MPRIKNLDDYKWAYDLAASKGTQFSIGGKPWNKQYLLQMPYLAGNKVACSSDLTASVRENEKDTQGIRLLALESRCSVPIRFNKITLLVNGPIKMAVFMKGDHGAELVIDTPYVMHKGRPFFPDQRRIARMMSAAAKSAVAKEKKRLAEQK
jgi:hypothetical protein